MVYITGGRELLDPDKILAKLNIQPGDQVADLGCGGAGHFIAPLGRLVGAETKIYAVDILKNVLKAITSKARLEGITNIRPVWSDLENVGATNITPDSLDFAVLVNVLSLSKKRENILKEALRLLKKGGKLLVVDWNKVPTAFGPAPDQRAKVEEIKTLAASLNYNLEEEFAAGKYHFGLILKK
ncbi:MAG: methyltransferase domain-containing protein [Candidatus Buchananbacteria bacterium]